MLPNFKSPEEAVEWMESLCRAFQTNPKEAEVALTELRRSDHAVQVSKIILERSQMPMAQFHALLALQEAVLARWDSVPPTDRRALNAYLWDFLCSEWASLERSVASQALRTFCVFWRRGWVGETEEAKLSLFALLQQGGAEGGVASLRSAKALFSLVSEFSSTRATALGLPLEFFRATHGAFNELGLDQSLALSMELLGETVKAVADPEALSEVSVLELVTTVVNVCAEVLSWEFNFVEAWQIPPTQELIRPGPRWRRYLVRPDFLGAVFDVYRRVRLRGTRGHGGTLSHALRQLLLQLSSVHGDIFENDEQRKAYASFLVQGAAAVLSAPFSAPGVRQEGAHKGAGEAAAEEAQADEYIGIASMAVRLVSNFQLSTLGQLDSFAAFAQHLAALTSRMLYESKALAGRHDEDVEWRRETFSILLEAWVAMAEDREVTSGRNPGMRKGVEDATFPLYQQYLEHELTVSRVEAEASVGQEEDDEEEEIGAADKDEQMGSAACLGRLSLASSLAAVDVQVRGVSEVLARLLETGLLNGQPALLPGGQGLSPAATGAMEQARTAVVLAAHLIADEDDGMVPERLHAVFLVDNHAADLLVNLVHNLLNLLELHVSLLGRGGGQQQHAGVGGAGGGGGYSSPSPLLSPYLGGALLWCLARWANSFLFADLSLYEAGFSFRLTQAFGSTGPQLSLSDPPLSAAAPPGVGGVRVGGDGGGAAVAGALLRASWMCLCAWPSQPDVCVNALDLMGTLVSRTKAASTTSLPLWWEIVASYDGGRQAAAGEADGARAWGGRNQGFRRLSVDLQGVLVQRLCEGVLNRASAPETALAKEGFEKVAGPVWERFRGLLHAVGGLDGKQRQSPQVVAESLFCVRLCRGVAVGCGAAGSHCGLGEAFVEQTYDGMTLLLTMHVSGAQSVVYEVLQYLREIADQLLIFMSSSRSMALYEACGKALKIYADQHAGSVRRVDPTAEEDSYQDVVCVLQLLSNLITKDLVDQSDEPTSEKDRDVKVTDVVFFGLKKVMPLMTEGLLQFPVLASQYFSLVGFLVQTFPDKLAGLEPELFQQVVSSLVWGSQHAEAAVARNSLQAISVMATQHVSDKVKGGEGLSAHLVVQPDLFVNVLRTLLRMLVFQRSLWDRVEACSMAVLPLIVCEQEGFQRLAEEMVASQPENVRQRLVEAFQKLHASHAVFGGGMDRAGRRRFPTAIQEFIMSCRGFLQTK